MKTLAIIPVKPFYEGKSRLSGVMTDSERYLLNAHSLRQTIHVIKNVEDIDEIIIVSRDPEVIETARSFSLNAIMEIGQGLNHALYQVNNTLNKNCDRVLVIPTDLPLLSREDIQKVLDLGCDKPVVVIVPDRHHRGTNALLVNPVGCIRYRFGTNSATKHAFEAQKRDIPTIIAVIPGISIDLDMEEDLDLLKSSGYRLPVQMPNPMEETIL